MRRDIEMKLLRTLLAVVDHGGFARAARALHVTQPTITQQIQRLEAIVQAPLVQRSSHPLRLSSVGQELVTYARRAVLMNDEVLDNISGLRSQERFKLGCSAHFAHALWTMLARLASERPDIQYATTTGISPLLADNLAKGELDAAILLGTETRRCEMLGRLELAWFGQVPVASQSPFPLALVGERSALSMRIIETLAKHNVRWRSVLWSSDPLAVRASVQAGLAYTALPSNVHLTDPLLRPASRGSLGPAPEPLPVYLAFSPSVREPVVEAMRAAVRETLSAMPLSPP